MYRASIASRGKNLTILASAVPKIYMGPQKCKTVHVTLTTPSQRYVVCYPWAMVILPFIFEVAVSICYEDMKHDTKC